MNFDDLVSRYPRLWHATFEGGWDGIQSSGLLARLLIEDRAQDYAQLWKRRFVPRIRAASLFDDNVVRTT